MSVISELLQSFSPGDMVHLYQLDTTELGGGVYAFTSTAHATQAIVFDGVTYTPIDIEAEGFEWNGKGAAPTPRVRISNANKTMTAAAITYEDLLGATFTRIRTYRQLLDGQPEADPTAYLPLDIYKVERKVSLNKVFIEWELSSATDNEGKQLPGRQIIRNNCTHIYRYFDEDAGAFDYTKASCPYTGTNYFSNTGVVQTNPSGDVCGKLLSSCRLRFGENGNLPFRGFPGAGRY